MRRRAVPSGLRRYEPARRRAARLLEGLRELRDRRRQRSRDRARFRAQRLLLHCRGRIILRALRGSRHLLLQLRELLLQALDELFELRDRGIGRASCRERV